MMKTKQLRMKTKQLRLIGLAVSLGIAGNAHAALLGDLQRYPDVTLGNTYLIYDHDALKTYNNGSCNSSTTANGCIGQLTLVSFSSTLNSGAYPAPTVTQLYAGGGGSDTTPDKMMTIGIQSSGLSGNIGKWASSTNANANKVTITNGTTPTDVDKFSWGGKVNNFGYLDNGKSFDGRWTFTSDTYTNMPANMSQFIDSVLTAAMNAPDPDYNGGFKISNSAGFVYRTYNANGTVKTESTVNKLNAFKRDWVFGTSAYTSSVQALLAPFLNGLSGTTCNSSTATNCKSFISSTVLADVFVPIPAAFWLWAGALASLLPSVRRITTNNNNFRSA